MCAGPKYEYMWADGQTIKKPISCSAPRYVDYLLTWVPPGVHKESARRQSWLLLPWRPVEASGSGRKCIGTRPCDARVAAEADRQGAHCFACLRPHRRTAAPPHRRTAAPPHRTAQVQTLLDDERIFPTEIGKPFPSDFMEHIRNIFKRLFRVYAHIYYCHFERIPAGSKCLFWQRPSPTPVPLSARLTALGGSALPGRGRPTGRPATASAARASRLPSRPLHRL